MGRAQNRVHWLLLLPLPLSLSSCVGSSSPGISPVLDGTITGHLLATGGPSGSSSDRLSGTVTVDGPEPRNVTVGPDGAFSVDVAPGAYRVTGQSQLFMIDDRPGECAALHRVTVSGGQTTTVDVLCQRK